MNAVDLYTAMQIVTQHVYQAQIGLGTYEDKSPEYEIRPQGNTLQVTCLAPLPPAQMHEVHREILMDERWVPYADLRLVLTGTLEPPAPHWPQGKADEIYADYDAQDDSLLIPLTVGGMPTRKVPTETGIMLNVQEDGTVVSLELRGIGQMIKDERRIYRVTRKQRKVAA